LFLLFKNKLEWKLLCVTLSEELLGNRIFYEEVKWHAEEEVLLVQHQQ